MNHNRVIRRVSRYGVLPLAALSIVVCAMTSVSAAMGRTQHHKSPVPHQPAMTSLGQTPRGLQAAVQRSMESDGVSPNWVIQEQYKLLGDWATNFGYSVSVSGGLAVVGLPTADGPNGEGMEGAAYIFVRAADGSWSKQATLEPSGGAAGDQFGTSVSISGGYVAVGAPDAHNFYGDAYVFVQASNGTWSEQQELSPSQNNQFSSYGISVAIAWPYTVVGAPGQGCAGYAYVFKSVNSAWTQSKQLTPTANGCPGRGYGMSVAASGGYVAVGSPGENGYTGAAYAYFSQGDTWPQQLPLLTGFNTVQGDQFGYSVAIDGSHLLAGVPFHQSSAGEAFMFARNSNTWYLQKVMASNGVPYEKYGYSVAVGSGYAVVGAPGENSLSGAAYAYRDIGGWPQYAQLTASDSMSGTQVGYSVAASLEFGTPLQVVIFAGAPGGENDAGLPATYIFSVPQIPKKTCYNNADPVYDTGVSIVSENDSNDSRVDSRGAVNFTLTKKCVVGTISTTGLYYGATNPADSVDVTFYKNQGGRPTKVVSEQDDLSYSDTTGTGSLTAFIKPVTLKKGSYFVSFVANMAGSDGGQWGWELTSSQVGNADQWENPGGKFGVCPTWGDVLTCTGYGNDFMVKVSG